MFSSTHACYFVSQVLKRSATRLSTVSLPSGLVPKKQNFTEAKVKENIWHLVLMVHLSDTCHVSFILRNFFDHSAHAAAKDAPQRGWHNTLFLWPDEWPTCLLPYLPTGPTPRELSQTKHKSEWHITVLPAAILQIILFKPCGCVMFPRCVRSFEGSWCFHLQGQEFKVILLVLCDNESEGTVFVRNVGNLWPDDRATSRGEFRPRQTRQLPTAS